MITVRCGVMMQDVEHVKCGAVSCKMWCDARCGGVKCSVMRDEVVRGINDAANIWRDLKCGVEYMECGVMGYVNSV